jgi:hypothetical protein
MANYEPFFLGFFWIEKTLNGIDGWIVDAH